MTARPTRVRWAGGGLLLVIAALLGFELIWVVRNTDQLRPITPGDVAPDFNLPEIDRSGEPTGRWIRLSELRGRVVLLDFWADWCKPCRQTLPHIERVYRRYRSRGLEVVSIKTDGTELKLAGDVVARTSFPMVVDSAQVADTYKVTTIPHLVLVDHLGVVRHVHSGGASAGDLAAEVEKLLSRLADGPADRP